MADKSFEVRPLATALGAEVFGLDLAVPLSETDFGRLRAAFVEHNVLAIRDQDIPPENYLAFVRRFGQIEDYPFAASVAGVPELTEILKLPGDVKGFGSGWHMDMSYRVRPPMTTILHAQEVPPVGGDTCFTSLRYAWLTLSARMRGLLDGLVAVHESWPPEPVRFSGMTITNLDKPREVARHPLVGVHPEAGEPFLFVSPYYAREIEGMSPEESLALLEFLNRHATRDELTCRVRWAPGTIVLWDNRWTLHQALDDDFGAILHGGGYRRRMHRAVIRDPRSH
jgi:taurine dioxygenase